MISQPKAFWTLQSQTHKINQKWHSTFAATTQSLPTIHAWSFYCRGGDGISFSVLQAMCLSQQLIFTEAVSGSVLFSFFIVFSPRLTQTILSVRLVKIDLGTRHNPATPSIYYFVGTQSVMAGGRSYSVFIVFYDRIHTFLSCPWSLSHQQQKLKCRFVICRLQMQMSSQTPDGFTKDCNLTFVGRSWLFKSICSW